MLVFKTIKPNKMKNDEFRKEFLSMVHKAERSIKNDFQKTTETWEHKVVFESLISLRSGPSVYVYTNDQIYQWVNDGTKPHDIVPREGNESGLLTYQVGFTPKTVPGALTSHKGGKYGDYTRRKAVHHPGFEARNFDKLIEEQWRPKFKDMAHEAMQRAARKCGHSI